MRSRSHSDQSRNHSRRLGILAVAGVTAVGLAVGGAVPASAAPESTPNGNAYGQGTEVSLNLFTVNDFHGRIEQSGSAGGIARLSTAVNAFREENPNTIFAAAGDMIGASTFTSFIQDDEPTIEALNAAGLDVSSVGNHEFDRGFADLTDRVMPLADWEYLGANVYHKDTTDPALPEYWITRLAPDPATAAAQAAELAAADKKAAAELKAVEKVAALQAKLLAKFPVLKKKVEAALAAATAKIESRLADLKKKITDKYAKQTVRVGFVGAVTDELPSLVSPDGIADISVGSPVDAANRVADELSDGDERNGEADIVVLLVHEGAATTDIASATDPATRFGQIVLGADDDIDAIVSGHTHLAYNHVIDGRPVISSGQYGERFSNMEIVYDRKQKAIVSMENTVYSMATAFDDRGNVTAWYAEPDPAIVPIVDEAKAVADELGSVVLGEAETGFGRAAASNPTGATSFPENRGGESTLGNFVADVQKWALNEDGTRAVDVAFMNPGGLRADLAAGEVTYAEAAAVQPFANTLVSVDLTGAQLKAVLEEQWQPAGASRPFLKLGVSAGFTYTYDPAAAKGSHITQMWLDGVEIDPAATYSVGANSFLAAGGDNFTTLGQGVNKADSGKIDLESMVDWFDAFGTATPDLAQRAVGVSVVGGTTVAAGASVTVNLSSLEFTRGEPAAGTVVVSTGGTELVSAPVVGGYSPTTDEVGTASATFVVPATASGETAFDVTVPSTGTTSAFTLTVTP
ncbi:2',3'-cyclic-nucleotide 2'-phosphodiesterase (5'-nucleotidase family) [Microbacterium terrae]|uniref:Endonuclease YhcR n=1 Tax=Microbacterium terrae TaxID=69369 RepID=A0A0M2GWK1_9MICO|nr:bifunctional UDP-sugar hydrolase/5'-nucleotidase [Microbacterium terrae]KJL38119.1 Endonuclease YhcR precursor [Microbacterium terrae]MBP1077532.1 2',3'-cyclic-nucleotide 2'-phosphodiesterase (5'-nucleotidase family) [Microbacterium terrae]GLJ99137.1 hypothetical protein GCM10017594_23340 [Microbacterium terrae]